MNSRGFTLVELLLASAIFMIILIVVSQTLGSTGSMTNKYVGRTELLEDTRTAGQLIEDEVAKAVYVYPPGMSVRLGSGSGYTINGPTSSSGAWTTGDRFLAFIQSPRNLAIDCAPAIDPALVGSGAASRDGCLLFVAYYPVLRSSVVTNASGGARINASAPNDNQWTLFEYRRWLPGERLLGTNETEKPTLNVTVNVPSDVSGSAGNMLADFLNSADGFSVSYGAATDRWCRIYNGGTPTILPCTDGQVTAQKDWTGTTVMRASFNIHAQMLGGAPVDLTPITFSAAPRNL